MDLFTNVAQSRRARLRALGWHEAAGVLHGTPCWRTPDGSTVLTEAEALRRLDRTDTREAATDEPHP
jgi:hypothetical protein